MILAIAYLILVQLLDYRDMKPASISQFDQAPALAIAQRSKSIIIYHWQVNKIFGVA